jgi:DNA processing protein
VAIPIDAPAYPALLRHIVDPPTVLWLKGHSVSLTHRAIAVVGSRNGTPAGLMTARRLGNELAAAGISVVSGLARGVDGAAHRGALDAGGVTVAVVGCGVDRTYPREHVALGAAILDRGALISEFPPGTSALPAHFPLRNRIISGLSRAVVVVEAHLKSGSLITARAALEQGRDVLAVPGNVASGCYRGSHSLIKDGARLVETVEDVLDEVGWRPVPERPAGASDKCHEINQLDGFIEPGGTIGLDELLARTGRPVTVLLAELSELELAGKVAKLPGGGFVRLD